jgi:epsilon-lactone hydrolase
VSLSAELLRIWLRWFIKRRNGPDTTVDDLRRGLAAIEYYIPAPSRRTKTTLIEPAGVRTHSVVTAAFENNRHILYLHGGAYVAGSPPLYRDFTWRLAKRARARVLCVDYRLAPEFPFPAAVDDAANVYRWLIENGMEPRCIAIAGDSAGGGLAFATLLKARDEGMPMPAAAVALSPWTDLALTGTSRQFNAKPESIMNLGVARRFAEYYLAGADPRTPYASPLYGDLAGLPPTLIQVGSDEAHLDDSVRMADKLRAAGCEVELEIWPRMPHVFQLFAKLLPEARQAIERIGSFLRAKM